ncbi:C40 family peptidase [Streptomyces mexicanus]|uniref:C40 family peptidase n=1 Tax=Streptomyces mexicanus TaxID=178566 RepID=A0A7X1HYT3_9ACTN|nr:C40 family peptidase [Streptomyces mexicanus]MBC2865680.1 C40 family peptidase [Streptomyces mexicanus]
MERGRSRRSVLAAAVTAVCGITVLGAPGTAFATARQPSPGPRDGGAPSPSGSPSATPTPDTAVDDKLEAVRTKLDKLYHEAAVATDAYNAAEEQAQQQSAEIAELTRKIGEGQKKLDELKDRAGAAARAQYATGGLPPEARLLLSEDPQAFLDGAGWAMQGERATRDLIQDMTRTQKELRQYADRAADRLAQLEATRKAKDAARKRIKERIEQAEKLQATLEKKQRERLAELERQAARRAQTAWLDTGVLKDVRGKASEAGQQAVKFATAQIGKPYEWGAEGPRTYDCSGLTSQAWAAAGRPIPRTSQEQWKRLPHVAVQDMRPGDLIIYFDDASHVALYVGGGTIVHAPRPGRTVTLAGAGEMPILGVVRPDAA